MKTTEYICDMCGEEAKEYGTGPSVRDSLRIIEVYMPSNDTFVEPDTIPMSTYHLHGRCFGKWVNDMKERKPTKAIVDPYEMAVDIAARRSE